MDERSKRLRTASDTAASKSLAEYRHAKIPRSSCDGITKTDWQQPPQGAQDAGSATTAAVFDSIRDRSRRSGASARVSTSEGCIQITTADMAQLNEDDELSDTLVDACIQSFRETLRGPDRCAVMSALWFWSVYADVAAAAQVGEHLLDLDFVYVPICTNGHWVGAIVCRCPDKDYRILLLDSMRRAQSPFRPHEACEVLMGVYRAIWRSHRHGVCPAIRWVMVTGVPVQPNLVDCAFYMLAAFQQHNNSLPALHTQQSPRWTDDLLFNHSLIRRMRDKLRQDVRRLRG